MSNNIKLSKYDMEETVLDEGSAEDMVVNHYLFVLRELREKSSGCKKDDNEYRKIIYDEIKKVIEETDIAHKQLKEKENKVNILKVKNSLNQLIKKYFQKESLEGQNGENIDQISKMACNELKSDIHDILLIKEVLEFYAEKICDSIKDKHNNISSKIFPESSKEIIILENEEEILSIMVNDQLNVYSIIPLNKLYKTCPLFSSVFYQRYWKTIAESIGHIYIDNLASIIKVDLSTLPDVPKIDGTYDVEVFDVNEETKNGINIDFKNNGSIWKISAPKNTRYASSKYLEKDYMNSIARCIDSSLKSIYNRTGVVVQVIPLEDGIEIDVDFGRGIDVVRLTEKQIELVQ